MKVITPMIGQIVQYQEGPEAHHVRPAIICAVLDLAENRVRLQLFGSRTVEFIDANYSDTPRQGLWRYVPKG